MDGDHRSPGNSGVIDEFNSELVVVFNYLLVTQCYTEDSCRPAIIDSRQKQRSQISFHALSFQKI